MLLPCPAPRRRQPHGRSRSCRSSYSRQKCPPETQPAQLPNQYASTCLAFSNLESPRTGCRKHGKRAIERSPSSTVRAPHPAFTMRLNVYSATEPAQIRRMCDRFQGSGSKAWGRTDLGRARSAAKTGVRSHLPAMVGALQPHGRGAITAPEGPGTDTGPERRRTRTLPRTRTRTRPAEPACSGLQIRRRWVHVPRPILFIAERMESRTVHPYPVCNCRGARSRSHHGS